MTERTAALTARVDRALPAEEFDAEVARIQAEQAARGPQTATAGFDLTFSVPKSVSVLWGVADANAQELIVAAHHAAVAQVLDLFEREVAATRTGHAGIAQVPVVGIAAAAYDHWDSRANDPQLHTHVVVSNKVMTAHDGQWRTLDSRAVHHAIVALSEHYNAVLADRLTGTFGLSWERRERGADRSAQWEVQGVSEELVAEFSSRARAIDLATDAKIADYVGEHGHYPSDRRIVGMRAEATLDTRPEKNIRALADLTAEWRARAQEIVRGDPTEWARKLTTTPPAQVVPQDSVPMYLIDQAAADVVDAVSEKRSTWRHWNLWAEASRRTMGWRFETVEDRELVVALITEAATRQSVPLTPGEVTTTLAALRRDGGTSALRPRHSTYYTSEHLLAAEDRLLALSQDRVTALVVPQHIVETVPGARVGGVVVDGEQAAALARVLASGRRLDLLVGPAGTGKSTAMAALLGAWTTQHGPGSVVGMAPSAAAAQVLAEDLGIGCDNTAKWVHDHRRGKADFRTGQLVILDEATLASTRTLEDIATRAAEVGAKVVLVGDPAQLQSVDAGGAFSMLVEARDGDIAWLVEVRCFVHEWEKAASLALRDGDVAAIDVYESHGRILEGTTVAMIDAAYEAWREDLRVGHSSILVTEAAESVRHLNERARAERIQSGLTSTRRDVPLRDDARASAGDVIITRRNDRRLRPSPDTWVRNGDRWTVTHVGSDGTLDVRRVGDPSGASLTLPAGYVGRHVDLGYAITGHRAQGVTVDTAHTVVTATTTRENFYVAMTRGRHGNYAYVATDTTDDAHIAPHPSDNPDAAARSVLYGVLQHVGAELSAHETVTAEQERWGSIAQLVAEYETIAQAGQHDRWATLLETSGLTEGQVDLVLGSDAYGALSAELRRAEANHHDLDELFPRLVAARDFADADDIASVLHHRLARATARPAGSGRTRRSPWLIAGLIPYASGVTDPEMHHALTEREELIEHRASAVLDRDLNEGEPWTAALGTKPADARTAQRWRQAGRVAAAYRDRYQITDDTPLGPGPRSDAQKLDAARATAALTRAQQLSRHTPNTEQPDLTMEARQGRAL